MIIDCRDWKTHADRARDTRRVFVDGVEIKGVWYVDTDLGIVKTYEILQDADQWTHSFYSERYGGNKKFAVQTFDRSMIPMDWEMEYPEGDVVSRTLRGKVELQPLSEAERTEAGIIDDGR